MHGGRHAWQGVCMTGGACVAGGMHAGETATEVGGMHLTGMHSCLKLKPVLKLCRIPTFSSQEGP